MTVNWESILTVNVNKMICEPPQKTLLNCCCGCQEASPGGVQVQVDTVTGVTRSQHNITQASDLPAAGRRVASQLHPRCHPTVSKCKHSVGLICSDRSGRSDASPPADTINTRQSRSRCTSGQVYSNHHMSNSSNNYSDYMGKAKHTEKSHPPSEVYPHNRSNSSIDYIIFPSTGQAKEVQKVKEGSFAMSNFKQYASPTHEYICFTECEQRACVEAQASCIDNQKLSKDASGGRGKPQKVTPVSSSSHFNTFTDVQQHERCKLCSGRRREGGYRESGGP